MPSRHMLNQALVISEEQLRTITGGQAAQSQPWYSSAQNAISKAGTGISNYWSYFKDEMGKPGALWAASGAF